MCVAGMGWMVENPWGYPSRSMIDWTNMARHLHLGKYKRKGGAKIGGCFANIYFVGFLHVQL